MEIENIVGQLNSLSIKYGNDFIFTNNKSIDIMFSLNDAANLFKISSVCIKNCDASINDLIACSCDKEYTFNELANIIVNCKLILKGIDDSGIANQHIGYAKMDAKMDDCITRFNEIITNASKAIEKDKHNYEIAVQVYDWIDKYWRCSGVIVYNNGYKPFCYIYKEMINGNAAFKINATENSMMSIDQILSIFPSFPLSADSDDLLIMALKENFIKIIDDNGFMIMPAIAIPKDDNVFINYKRMLYYMINKGGSACVSSRIKYNSIRDHIQVTHYHEDFLDILAYDDSYKGMLMKYGMINNKINIDNFVVMIMENDMHFGEKY